MPNTEYRTLVLYAHMWQWTFNKASDFIPKERNLCSYEEPGLATHFLRKEMCCDLRVEFTQHAV